MTRTLITAVLTGAALSLLGTAPARAASMTFDFSWSSGIASFSGSGANTAATGSAFGTFTLLDVGAGETFDHTDLTAFDITVTTTNYGTVSYGLGGAVLFDGQIDVSGNFATFSTVFLDLGGDDAFGCSYTSCSFIPEVFHGYDGSGGAVDAWRYGTQAAAQASFGATISAVVPAPSAVWLLGTALAGLGGRQWLRRKAAS